MLNKKIKLFIVILLALLIGLFAFYFYNNQNKFLSLKNPKINLEILEKKDNIMPVVILGSGPAGLSAGIYSARLGFKTLIIEGNKPGGQLTGTTYVENWPGAKKILGPDLMKNMHDQDKDLGVLFLQDSVKSVDFSHWPFEVVTNDGIIINALSVIIATGSSPKKLNIPGEDEYWGKGVTTCAICDAPFYKGKKVLVIGGGDSAAEQVLQLSPHVEHITMLARGSSLRASQAMQSRIKEINNLTIVYNNQLQKIVGDGSHVTSVDILNNKTNNVSTIVIDGVFLAIGHEPNTALFKGFISMDKIGYINVQDRSQKTSVAGVFAAGDVEDHVYMQAGVAAGAGIKAALDAGVFLHSINFTSAIADKLKNKFFDVKSTQPSQVINIKSSEEFKTEVEQSNIPVILDFWAVHCPTCMHMLPSFESLSKKYEGQVKFIKVNIDESPELVKKLYILKVPSFIVYKDGKSVARYHDFMDKVQMAAFIEKFI